MPPLLASAPPRAGDRPPERPPLDVVVPVHDEEADLEPCLRRLHAYLAELPWTSRITVAENASTDGTLAVARRGPRASPSPTPPPPTTPPPSPAGSPPSCPASRCACCPSPAEAGRCAT